MVSFVIRHMLKSGIETALEISLILGGLFVSFFDIVVQTFYPNLLEK